MDLELKDDNHTNTAHSRWYAKQPSTLCRRCDRPFPNVDSGKTEYCSYECELGWHPEPPKPPKRKYKIPTHKKHLNVASWKSKWAR